MIRNVVIVTAKGGNTTLPNKNVVPILGVPVFLYPLRAAKMARLTQKVVVTTEDKTIRDLALKEGVELIDRPIELSQPDSQHKDVIRHAVAEIERRDPGIENVIVLLGNTVQVTPGLIDQCFEMLDSGDCDSVATVWRAQDDHPFRALTVNDGGYAKSFLGTDVSSNRQSYPPVYFYDQGVWAFKKACAFRQEGPNPWVWLGTRCRLLERLWVTGRDIHSWIDVSASAWYLTAVQTNDVASPNVVQP
jgi:N-acylneuraminate cytidylyltransferase